jgi:hypothetical protein
MTVPNFRVPTINPALNPAWPPYQLPVANFEPYQGMRTASQINTANPQTSGDDIMLTNVISLDVKAYWTGMNPLLITQPNQLVNTPQYSVNVQGGFWPATPNTNPPTPPVVPALINTNLWVPYTPASTSQDYPYAQLPFVSPNVNAGTAWANRQVFDTWTGRTTQFQPPNGPLGIADPTTGALFDYSQWNLPTPNPATPDAAAIAGLRVPMRIHIMALKITIRVWDPQTEQARQITIIQDV